MHFLGSVPSVVEVESWACPEARAESVCLRSPIRLWIHQTHNRYYTFQRSWWHLIIQRVSMRIAFIWVLVSKFFESYDQMMVHNSPRAEMCRSTSMDFHWPFKLGHLRFSRTWGMFAVISYVNLAQTPVNRLSYDDFETYFERKMPVKMVSFLFSCIYHEFF